MRSLWLLVLVWGGACPAAEGVGQAWGVVLGEVERGRPAAGTFDAEGRAVELFEPVDGAERVGVAAGLAGELELGSGWSVFGAVDTGVLTWRDGAVWSSGRPVGDEAAETWMVRGAGVRWLGSGGVEAVVGKQRVRMARGLLLDAHALGGEVAVEGARVGIRAGVWWPGRAAVPDGWPVVRLEVGWRPDPFVEVRGFWATTRFEGAAGRRLVQPGVESAAVRRLTELVEAFAEAREGSSARRVDPRAQVGSRAGAALDRLLACGGFDATVTPWWAGVEGEALLDGHTLSGVALVGRGRGSVRLTVDGGCPRLRDFVEQAVEQRVFELWAAGAQGVWRMYLADWLYVGAFGLVMSGHASSTERLATYTALVAPAPFVARPTLVFDGGVAAGLADRPAVVYGYAGRGVVAPGLTALWVPADSVEVDASWSPLWSAVEGPHGGSFYGHEVDVRARWQPLAAVVLRADGAVLRTGDFFPAGGPWWRVGLAVEVEGP